MKSSLKIVMCTYIICAQIARNVFGTYIKCAQKVLFFGKKMYNTLFCISQE